VVLQRTWELHDVRDVEALLRKEIHDSPYVAGLLPHELDDLVAFLFEVAWRAGDSYDPARGRFSTMLTTVVRRRVVDWHRSRYRTVWKFRNRVYVRGRPQFVPLDDRLDDTLGARAGDPADSGDPDLERVLAAGRGARARDLETLGLRPARRAPRRVATSEVADNVT
jgi:DNA-directed RNA polymerase specialized sigma24 family protein